MPTIQYYDTKVFIDDHQSILEAFRESGVELPNSCQAGACQTCIMEAIDGEVTAQAQQGLRASQKEKNYFLACQCYPETDMQIRLPDDRQLKSPGVIIAKEYLNKNVLRLLVKTITPFDYHAGQYVTLWKDDKTARSYSIANIPNPENILEFHIKILENGVMSQWLAQENVLGHAIDIQGPVGDCYYTPEAGNDILYLVGTGTGLAPLYGIANDALSQQHQGDIHLYHGSLTMDDLYLDEKLAEMQKQYSNFYYHPVVLNQDESCRVEVQEGDILKILTAEVEDFQNSSFYLCGPEDLVKNLQKNIFLSGAALKKIYADVFLAS